MQGVPSKELSDREIELLQELRLLQEALSVTLDYIQTELQPNPPANIARYRDLLEPAPDSHVTYAPVAEFLDVVTSMARFLSNSTAMDIFRRRGVTGFADWVILATIATQPPGLTDRQLPRYIGTSLKRTRRLVDGLSNAGMILLSPGTEAETSVLQVTPAGESRVGEIEAELLPILNSFLGEDPSRLRLCVSLVRRLSRIHDRANRRGR